MGLNWQRCAQQVHAARYGSHVARPFGASTAPIIDRRLTTVQFATDDERQRFWRLWKANKAFMRAKGYRIGKRRRHLDRPAARGPLTARTSGGCAFTDRIDPVAADTAGSSPACCSHVEIASGY